MAPPGHGWSARGVSAVPSPQSRYTGQESEAQTAKSSNGYSRLESRHRPPERIGNEAPNTQGGPMPSMTQRRCENCGGTFEARTADVKRGWARFCSKSCKAIKQEKRTGQHAAYMARSNSNDGYDRDMDAAGHPFASGYFGHGQE